MNQNIPDYKYQIRDFIPLNLSRYRKRNMQAFKNLIPEVRYRDLGLFAYNLLFVTIPTAITLYVYSEPIGRVFFQFSKGLEKLLN